MVLCSGGFGVCVCVCRRAIEQRLALSIDKSRSINLNRLHIDTYNKTCSPVPYGTTNLCCFKWKMSLIIIHILLVWQKLILLTKISIDIIFCINIAITFTLLYRAILTKNILLKYIFKLVFFNIYLLWNIFWSIGCENSIYKVSFGINSWVDLLWQQLGKNCWICANNGYFTLLRFLCLNNILYRE